MRWGLVVFWLFFACFQGERWYLFFYFLKGLLQINFFGVKAGYFWADSRLSSAINSLAVSALRMQSACVTGDLNQDLAAALLHQR